MTFISKLKYKQICLAVILPSCFTTIFAKSRVSLRILIGQFIFSSNFINFDSYFYQYLLCSPFGGITITYFIHPTYIKLLEIISSQTFWCSALTYFECVSFWMVSIVKSTDPVLIVLLFIIA